MTSPSALLQLGPEIATRLGLSPHASVPYAIVCVTTSSVEVRLAAPGARELDLLESDETKDIIGVGETLVEAFENACSCYRAVAAREVMYERGADAQGKLFLN